MDVMNWAAIIVPVVIGLANWRVCRKALSRWAASLKSHWVWAVLPECWKLVRKLRAEYIGEKAFHKAFEEERKNMGCAESA